MAKTARRLIPTPITPDALKTPEPSRAQPSDEEIAVRAYYIYMERGGADGNAAEDWLQAERELNEGQ
jgi:DUF2934 family protein